MSHTPTPWRDERLRILAPDDRETIICNVTGAITNPIAKADAAHIVAAINFFHSDDGRTVDTDKIPQGGFWEMLWFIEHMAVINGDRKARALLDRMGVK